MTEKLRIAGISDTHFGAKSSRTRPENNLSHKELSQHVRDMSRKADVIVHCGDFTDRGDEASLNAMGNILSEAKIPIIGVVGNHDITQDLHMASNILRDRSNTTLLDGHPMSFKHDITFLGIPGFLPIEEGSRMNKLNVSREEYNDMASLQFSEFTKGLRQLKGKNNIIIFHFDQLQVPRIHLQDPEEPEEVEVVEGPVLTDLGHLVDRNASKIKLMLHGHDHRPIERPSTTPGNVDVIDLALPIQIKMHAGVPYRIIEVPLK